MKGTIILLGFVVLLISGCSSLQESDTPLPVETNTPVLISETAFLPPESTSTPAGTASSTPSPAPSSTATPYGQMDFSQVIIAFHGNLPDWEYFVALDFPNNVPPGNFYALVDGNKRYDCQIYPDHPKRLYCYGPQVRVYDWADLELFVNNLDTVLFSSRFFIPMLPD